MCPLSITVITPTLNQAPFIRATIDSVLNQHYEGLEYVIMDGGSTDSTLDILKSYGNAFQWTSSKDAGQTDAINKGWQSTSGDIIAWLNSDDLYCPGALQLVSEFFTRHPEVDFLYGDANFIDASGKKTGRYPTQPYNYINLVKGIDNYLPQPATFIRRSVLIDEGYLDTALAYDMDFDYWLRLGLHHQAVYLPVCLAELRLHDNAKSVAQLGKFADELIRIYQKLFARPDLREALRKIEKEVQGNVFYHAADSAYWSRNIKAARHYALTSFQLTPRLHGLWFWLALGSLGYPLANRLYGNPYDR